jgi:hypothetical protein
MTSGTPPGTVIGDMAHVAQINAAGCSERGNHLQLFLNPREASINSQRLGARSDSRRRALAYETGLYTRLLYTLEAHSVQHMEANHSQAHAIIIEAAIGENAVDVTAEEADASKTRIGGQNGRMVRLRHGLKTFCTLDNPDSITMLEVNRPGLSIALQRTCLRRWWQTGFSRHSIVAWEVAT